MRKVLLAAMLISALSAALEIEPPDIGGAVIIGLQSFSADSGWGQFGSAGRRVASPSRFGLRKATLEFSGRAGGLMG